MVGGEPRFDGRVCVCVFNITQKTLTQLRLNESLCPAPSRRRVGVGAFKDNMTDLPEKQRSAAAGCTHRGGDDDVTDGWSSVMGCGAKRGFVKCCR